MLDACEAAGRIGKGFVDFAVTVIVDSIAQLGLAHAGRVAAREQAQER